MLAHVAAQPGFIREACRGWCDHQIGGFRKPRNRNIGLNSGSFIEELGIRDFAHWAGQVCAAHIVQKCLGIAALDPDFTKGGHIIHPHSAANGAVFTGSVFKPVLPFP